MRGWPNSVGLTCRIKSEWVAELNWIAWPDNFGMGGRIHWNTQLMEDDKISWQLGNEHKQICAKIFSHIEEQNDK